MTGERQAQKIGLMGGTFDPIHNAHLALADCAVREAGLSGLWFLPAGNPYLHKHKRISSVNDRNRMVELALEGREGFSLSRIEQMGEGQTYTADTLRRLNQLHPGTRFYFIIGADQLYQIESWYQPAEVLRGAAILAARRPRDGREGERAFPEQVQYLREKYQAEIHILPFMEMDISSTQLRRMAARGEDISRWVPAGVSEYILKKRLYLEGA